VERQKDEGSGGRRGVGGTQAGRPLQRPRLSGTDLGGIIGCPETMTRGDWAPCWPLLWAEHVTAARRCFRATAGALGTLLETEQLLVLLRRQVACWRAAATATMLPMGSCRALRRLWLWQAVRGPLQAMSVVGAASRVDDNAAACGTLYLCFQTAVLCAMHAAPSYSHIALPHPQCIAGSTGGSRALSAPGCRNPRCRLKGQPLQQPVLDNSAAPWSRYPRPHWPSWPAT
jgi:hypothetical protein